MTHLGSDVSFWIDEKKNLLAEVEKKVESVERLLKDADILRSKILAVDSAIDYLKGKIGKRRKEANISGVMAVAHAPKPNLALMRDLVSKILKDQSRFLHKTELENCLRQEYPTGIDLSSLSNQLTSLKNSGATKIIRFNRSKRLTFHGLPGWINYGRGPATMASNYKIDAAKFASADISSLQVYNHETGSWDP